MRPVPTLTLIPQKRLCNAAGITSPRETPASHSPSQSHGRRHHPARAAPSAILHRRALAHWLTPALFRRLLRALHHRQRHSRIEHHSPASVQFGTDAKVCVQRAVLLDAAFAAHSERFVRRAPAVWSSPDQQPKKEEANRRSHEDMSQIARQVRCQSTALPEVTRLSWRARGAVVLREVGRVSQGRGHSMMSSRGDMLKYLRFRSARDHSLGPTGVSNRRAEPHARGPSFVGVGRASHRWEPLVSIIIPAFNHAPFVGQCLDSVVADDYPNKEIFVIDDGSSDGTLDVIESWADGHERAIRISVVSRPNRGATRTLNELLSMARGELVLPIASDDYLLPGGVRALVAALAADPTCQAVFGDCVVVDKVGQMIFPSSLFAYRHTNRDWLVRRLADELITNWTLAGSALLYVREPILSIGGYSQDLLVEDWDFYLRLAAKGWLRFVDCKVSAYRLHDNNANRNPETARRRSKERRKVALRAARHFRGRRRLVLLLEVLSMPPSLHGLRTGRLTYLPFRAARMAIKVMARRLASLG